VLAAAPPSAPPHSAGRRGHCAPVARRASRACRRRGAVGHRRDRHREARPWTRVCAHRPAGDDHRRHRRPWTTASARHHEQDARQRRRRPSTTASAHHHAQDVRHRRRRPSTTASAHHHAQDARQRHRRPWTRACAHRPEQDVRHRHRRPSTTASAHHHAQDVRLRRRRPSTTASAHHPAAAALRALPRAPLHDRRHAALEERPRIPARTEACRRHVRAGSATIRGPGPQAGCLDRMSRSLCSCRPRGPDDVCGVVGRTEVKVQANGCWLASTPSRVTRARSTPATATTSGHRPQMGSRAALSSTRSVNPLVDSRCSRGGDLAVADSAGHPHPAGPTSWPNPLRTRSPGQGLETPQGAC
jgi:hypothetical protein